MDLRVRSTSPSAFKGDAVVLFARPGESLKRVLKGAGPTYPAAVDRLVERKAFGAKPGQTQVLHGGADDRLPTVVVVGLGKAPTAETLRDAASAAVRAARQAGARDVAVLLPHGKKPWLKGEKAAEAVAEGAVIGLYRFESHKSEPSKDGIDTLTLLAPRGEAQAAEKGAESGRIIGEAVCLARDLGNQPGNVATPTYLAETATRLAEENDLSLEVLEEADMQRLGMGALLGVSQGSHEPAKLIMLTYEPKKRRSKVDTVALVGKGLTFDSGGISIKPANKMEDMKFDMCGGAAVLGAMQAVAQLEVPVRVVGVVPASENLAGSRAYKPGDVLEASNGTTIEVKNTDAEGRLILADALAYTTSKMRPKPKAVIDLATLTGAVLVALGDQHAALVSNDERLAERVKSAGDVSGDDVWRLPITDGYRDQLKSTYADVSNLGAGGAGTITAAAFLEKFTSKVPWAHIDIAGMAWTEKQSGKLTKGGTGFGVRLLSQLLRDWKSGS